MSIDFLTYVDGSQYAFGYAGERMIAQALRETLGKEYRVRILFRGGHDIEIYNRSTKQITKIEIKSARKNKRGTYKAILRKNDKYGKTNCAKSDLIIFALFELGCAGNNPHIFIIPSSVVKSAYIEVPRDVSAYAGKYAPYRMDLSNIGVYLK